MPVILEAAANTLVKVRQAVVEQTTRALGLANSIRLLTTVINTQPEYFSALGL